MSKGLGAAAVWLFDWYLRLEWVGKVIAGAGFGASVISSFVTFLATAQQGLNPLLGIFLAFLAMLLFGVITLIAMEITGTRTPPRRIASVNKIVRTFEKVPVLDALMYAVNREWPAPDDKLKDGQENPCLIALERMRGLAGEGRITVWGKLSAHHLPVAIPSVFWITNQFDLTSVVFQSTEESKTEAATIPASRVVYYDLKVDRGQVEELWPRY